MPRFTQQITITLPIPALHLLDDVLPASPRGRSGQIEELILNAARSIIGERALSEFRRDPKHRIRRFSPVTLTTLARSGHPSRTPQAEYWVGKRSSLEIEADQRAESLAAGTS